MRPDADYPMTAIVYADGGAFERFLQSEVAKLKQRGLRLAGLIQHSRPNEGSRKCDMSLQDLMTGDLYDISEQRGRLATGCVLNTDYLLRACEAAKAGLLQNPDLLVLSKFGKSEVEGGGFRSLITAALDVGVPVVIGVPAVNLAPFREFAGDFAREIELAQLGADGLANSFRDVEKAAAPTLRREAAIAP